MKRILFVLVVSLQFFYGCTESGVIEKGVFSVSESTTIRFSKGNLQYNASSKKWRFAEKQYDIIGKENNNKSENYSGWIDLFCWGTSGWDSGAECYQPYSEGGTFYKFIPGKNEKANLSDEDYKNADWGIFNKISNGGNKVGIWRTLTVDEWDYLLYKRENANILKEYVFIEGIAGIALFPDDWVLPEGVSFQDFLDHGSFRLSAKDWKKLESDGAVFLPAAGGSIRSYYSWRIPGASMMDFYYWTATAASITSAWSLHVNEVGSSHKVRINIGDRSSGCSVRLVQDVK